MILVIWRSIILAEEFAERYSCSSSIHLKDPSYRRVTINLYRFFCEQLSAPKTCRSHRRCPTRGFPSLTREFWVTIFSC